LQALAITAWAFATKKTEGDPANQIVAHSKKHEVVHITMLAERAKQIHIMDKTKVA